MREKTEWRKELDELKSGGFLKASNVVARASNPKSALHSMFEWDDKKAGVELRLMRAREIIRMYKVTIVPNEGPREFKIRQYVSLTEDRKTEGGGYREILTVVREPDLRTQLLRDAKEDLKRWRIKYAELEELASVFAEVDKVIDVPDQQAGKAKRKEKKVV